MTIISVIIPLYNVERYILECLESVASQTFNENIECIIVDDCGCDNSVILVDDFISKYSGPITFKLLHHNINKGLSAARNTGTRASEGEYVYFLDSDDYLFPDSLLNLYQVAKEYPKAEVIQGSTTPSFLLSKDNKPDYTEDVEWIRKGFSTFYIYDPAWNRLVKRDFIIKNHLYFVEGYIQEDTIWSFHLQKHVRKMAFCFEITYFYRYNPQGIMHGATKEKEAKSFARVFNYVLDDMIRSDSIETYEIEYLEKNALRIINILGFERGNILLSTQNNPIFNKLLKYALKRSSYIKERKRSIKYVFFRILRFYCDFQLSKIRSSLCDKRNLLLNHKHVDITHSV